MTKNIKNQKFWDQKLIQGKWWNIVNKIKKTIPAKYDKIKDWVMDPKGYFLIKVDRKNKLLRVVQGFYNDGYFIDQNACSSPHLEYWVGKSYLLIAEIFISLNELFQANATLETLIENTDNTEIKTLAIDLLNKIKDEE